MKARGLSVREIHSHLEERYGTEVSPTLISNVTDAVGENVKLWQARPLDAVYPIQQSNGERNRLNSGSRN